MSSHGCPVQALRGVAKQLGQDLSVQAAVDTIICTKGIKPAFQQQ